MVKKNIHTIFLLASIMFFALIGMTFVSAGHIVNISSGGVSYNVSEDVQYVYNISVNNTDTVLLGNITQVFITIDSSFKFISGTNQTSSLYSTLFINTSTILNWTNVSGIIDGGSNGSYFTFNLTATNPGNYTIVVTTINDTGASSSNISVRVSDTTAPSVNFTSPTTSSSVYRYSLSMIVYNISVSDYVAVSYINVTLYNSTWQRINYSATGASPLYGNFGNIPVSGKYYLNASANDTSGNINSTFYEINVVDAIQFNGTVKDENGIPLNNSNVSVTVRNQNGWSVVGYNTTVTNVSGQFNLTIALNGISQATWEQWIYETSITHFNISNTTHLGSFADFKSKAIPGFPFMMLPMLSGTIFYLTPAATLNISAINSTGHSTNFSYQVKDTKLGYPIASDMSNLVTQATIYVPKNRNYSIMIYPYRSMPVSFEWNNFSSPISYNINTTVSALSNYNATTSTLHKQFNTSMTMTRVTGYFNVSKLNWTNFTIIPYLLEPGNMVHAEYGAMPYNLSCSVQFSNVSDIFNLSTGFYNISLPATVESSTVILFASAVGNDSYYYGGFSNVSLSYAASSVLMNFTHITRLLGIATNITMNRMDGVAANIAIPTKKQRFMIVNGTNVSLGNNTGHIEVTVDYSSLGARQFTWMVDVAQSSLISYFDVPLLNSTGIKEMNVFVSGGGGVGDNSQFAPKRTTFTAAQLGVNSLTNISITYFNPSDIENSVSSGQITINLYISNSTCDVPNPPAACILVGSKNMNKSDTANGFNPMHSVMGGGKISFRMGVGNISVHYINVDMMASGPPDALFDSSTTNTTSGDSFAAALRFGSGGPTIYDYVMVSLPYLETAGNGLNDSYPVNVSVPVFYDDNWNPIWNSSQNGTNGANLAANTSHYSTYQGSWEILMNGTICTTSDITSSVLINSTKPCYIDTSANKIWIRLPHFSGTSPSVSGTSAASPAAAAAVVISGGGSGGATVYWIGTKVVGDAEFSKGATRELVLKERIKITISNKEHYIGVVGLTASSVTINVSSSPQQAALSIGSEKKFDVTSDGYYDLSVKLNSISNNKASLTVKSISEKVAEEVSTGVEEKPAEEVKQVQKTEGEIKEEKSGSLTVMVWWMVILVSIVLIIIVITYLIRRQPSGPKLKKRDFRFY